MQKLFDRPRPRNRTLKERGPKSGTEVLVISWSPATGSVEFIAVTVALVWDEGSPSGVWRGKEPAPFRFHPDLASHLLSYTVSGLIFYVSKWKGITIKIYVCFKHGWFPNAESRNRCFPFPFFIPALGESK